MDVVVEQGSGLSELAEALKGCANEAARAAVLLSHERVSSVVSRLKNPLTPSLPHQLVLCALIAIGQYENVFGSLPDAEQWKDHPDLMDALIATERFYEKLGGIVGYHHTLVQLLFAAAQPQNTTSLCYLPPEGIDIFERTLTVQRYSAQGLLSLPLLAEVYPVGGAADRLRLFDPLTQDPLPAVCLEFCGYSLLEGLIRDVQAREFVYFKLFHTQITTPLAMMTSPEKNNHQQVTLLCEKHHWFHRDPGSFRLFMQPAVPVIDDKGDWFVSAPGHLVMKPGGHGALWKRAQDCGVLDWMRAAGRSKMLVRQINNPIAGIDEGLLTFCGVGYFEEKQFGFASCPRQVHAAEGVNVVAIQTESDATRCWLTNIEYCDFERFGITDQPRDIQSPYSQFPSNTNILFADIQAVQYAVAHHPLPGLIANMKSMVYCDDQKVVKEAHVVRLESMMQNLADYFDSSKRSDLPTFLTYHHRHKTISALKKMRASPSDPLLETPEGCLYDLMRNAHELLSLHCKMQVPPLPSVSEYVIHGPSWLLFYHPALGPHFTLIGQKIRQGSMALGSELVLEIAELDVDHLDLSGALEIRAEQVIGKIDPEGILRYSHEVGQCVLHNVTVSNRGIDRSCSPCYWKRDFSYHERCVIEIQGNGQLHATGVTLRGSMHIVVPSQTRLTLSEQSGQLHFHYEPLTKSTPYWSYELCADGELLCRPF